MAEPALQYDEFEDIEPIEIPAGGIATFLTAKEGMFADDDNIPQGGIAQVKAVADQLAEFGRKSHLQEKINLPQSSHD